MPPSDELVLVSGVPPKRAHKTRYYQDIWLKSRVLPPPALVTTSAGPSGDRPATDADDWTTLAPPRTSLGGYRPVRRRFLGDDDPANGGIRREPTLPEHEAIASQQAKPSPEFAVLEDEPDDDAVRATALNQNLGGSRGRPRGD